MELFTDGDFWTIVAIVVSALGVYRAEKADRRRECQEAEKRREAGEKWLAEQISTQRQELTEALDSQKQEVGHRIERLEDRFDKNHREVTAGLAELKAAVSALSMKVDERSHPRSLEGAGLSSAGADVAAGVVREPPVHYSTDKPKGEAEETPESGGSRPEEVAPD